MVDLDPSIWENKTLGEAANGIFLDEEMAQHAENVAAAREGRPARTVEKIKRWPLGHADTTSGIPSQNPEVKFETPTAKGK